MTYGTLTVEVQDGKRVVTRAENPERILVTGELLDRMEEEGYLRGGLYWFDDGGQWTYRKRDWEPPSDTWVLERVR